MKVIDGKAGVRFQSDTLAELSSDYQRISKEYDDSQKSIVQEIVNIAGN